jgi:hypothetical protein
MTKIVLAISNATRVLAVVAQGFATMDHMNTTIVTENLLAVSARWRLAFGHKATLRTHKRLFVPRHRANNQQKNFLSV